ncbi:hypothetical protein [Nibrella viscosa]|uniref:hypothetical protein n=1 Tax=Nibrella viscosa TaxID=1084524 RepID=UPI0031EEC187
METGTRRQEERLEVIDSLRGFSLIGIIVAHCSGQFLAGFPPPADWRGFMSATAFDVHQATLSAFYMAGVVLLFWQTRPMFYARWLLWVGVSFRYSCIILYSWSIHQGFGLVKTIPLIKAAGVGYSSSA